MATIKGKASNAPEDTGTQQARERKATQFKPGQSGNPKGRPKGARNRLGTRSLAEDTAGSSSLSSTSQLHSSPRPVTDFIPVALLADQAKYDPKSTPKLVRGMAKQGLSEGMMARILEISPSTFSLWKTQYSAFSKALEYGREACNGALEATAVQRALGYSYETEKAFQTGVRMTVTETMPPDPNMLKFLLERRMPEQVSGDQRGAAYPQCWGAIPSVLQAHGREGQAGAQAGGEDHRLLALR